MSHLNTFTNQPVIRREQTYVLDRKLVSIHSEDRDVRKWKNSNKFEVRLPEAIKNVQSMRLINISVPNNLYTFTNSYQNTKLTFKITPSNYAVANNNVENKLNVNKTNNYTITIDEGVYTNEQMANMLANKMNETVTTFLKGDQTAELGGSALVVDYNYTHFVVKYNEVKRLFVFGNRFDSFSITSNSKIEYNITDCEQKIVWDQYTKWGLPFYLGFEKKAVTSTVLNNANGARLDHETTAWITPATDISANNTSIYQLASPNMSSIYGETDIYLDIDKYNNLSEISPYAEATNNMYNNDYRGMIKNAFAKIPLKNDSTTLLTNSSNGSLAYMMSHFTTPVESIQKLLFRFRFHDGRLVDFKDTNFNFVIEFNCLLDEPMKQYNLRVPATLTL